MRDPAGVDKHRRHSAVTRPQPRSTGDHGESLVRAFLAFEVAPPLQEPLVHLKRQLAESVAGVRWVRDENLHATVRFLGGVAPEMLDRLHRALSESLRAVAPFPVRASGLGVFPNLRRPRVIRVAVDGAAPLQRLAHHVDATLEPFGFRAEARPYLAHVTLGRVPRGHSCTELSAALDTHKNIDFIIFIVHELNAYQSDLRPDGAAYTKLWTIPLTGPTGGQPNGT